MADCCGARRCTCTLVAGPGVEIDGGGSTSNPYVISASGGGSGTPTVIQAGDTPTVDTTVTGTGTTADPVVVSSVVRLDATPPAGGSNLIQAGPDGLFVECDQVRDCFTAGDGITYDPATGQIAARPSTDAGNTLGFGSDGGLYTPPSSGGGTPTVIQAGDTPTVDTTVTGSGTTADPVVVSANVRLDSTPPGGGTNLIQSGPDGLSVELETGCGLTGDGSPAAPLAVATATWPYACTPEDNGTAVVCDADGVLRGAPEHGTYFDQFTEMRDYANLPVPPEFDAVADTFTWEYTNPDPCRSVIVFLEREADVDFDLPAGAGAAAGQDTDEMSYFRNTGTTTILDQHVQSTKVYRHQVALAPGATANVSFPVSIGRGSGGATYNRIQVFLRAMMHTI